MATLDTLGWWMVGSSHIYIPSLNTKIEHSNVAGSDTGRDETGVMHIDWVRRDVRKDNLRYPVLTAAELTYLFDLMQGKEFLFTCRDKGTTVSFNAYVGETNYNFYNHTVLNGTEVYTDVSLNVIEL